MNSKFGFKKIIGAMGICCLMPLIATPLLLALGIRNSFIVGGTQIISVLICPLVMGGMMFMVMKSGNRNSCCKEKDKL